MPVDFALMSVYFSGLSQSVVLPLSTLHVFYTE